LPQIYADLCKSVFTDLRKSAAKITCATKNLVAYCAPPSQTLVQKSRFSTFFIAVFASMCIAFIESDNVVHPACFNAVAGGVTTPTNLTSIWRRKV
jgi:hypothetical protein